MTPDPTAAIARLRSAASERPDANGTVTAFADDLRAVVDLASQAYDAREDYAAIEASACAIVRAFEDAGSDDDPWMSGDLTRAIVEMRDNGRHGWWEKSREQDRERFRAATDATEWRRPEWRAPPDTMREELPSARPWPLCSAPKEASHPEFSDSGRAHVAKWVSGLLGAECEWAKDDRPGPFEVGNWMLLITGSEWVCALVRDLKIGRFRVVRVVPLPKEET